MMRLLSISAGTAMASASVKRLLVERPPDDDADHVGDRQPAQAAQVVEAGHATGEHHGELDRGGQLVELLQVGAAEHAVAGDVGVDDALHTRSSR